MPFTLCCSAFNLAVLQPSGFNWVHLDHRHMGVGGDDSWSPTGGHLSLCSVHAVHEFPVHGQRCIAALIAVCGIPWCLWRCSFALGLAHMHAPLFI